MLSEEIDLQEFAIVSKKDQKKSRVKKSSKTSSKGIMQMFYKIYVFA